MNIHTLVRPNIKKLKPYSSARSLYKCGIFFDANENAFGSAASIAGYPELNRYPDPSASALRAELAKYLGLSAKSIFAGNGSDEVIDLLIRIFVNPDESIAILEPTYGMYRVAADTAGVATVALRLDRSFGFDAESLVKKLPASVKIIFLCSPNNPTGNVMPPREIETLCKRFGGIVVVDEAYVEFSSAPSFAGKVNKLKNLVVIRTLSKVWGLAGARVGYAIADENIIGYLDKVRHPYNLNRVSQSLAIRAIKNEGAMKRMRKAMFVERKKLAKALVALQFKVFPSETNFLLVKYQGVSQIAKNIAKREGIIIRDFNKKPMLKDCVRITVGTSRENAKLISALKKRV